MLSLQFDGDRLIGCNAIGWTSHVGVMRGLVEGQVQAGRMEGQAAGRPHAADGGLPGLRTIAAASSQPHPPMNITFKLYATLTQYLPLEHRAANRMALDVAPGASIAQIIEPFGLPAQAGAPGARQRRTTCRRQERLTQDAGRRRRAGDLAPDRRWLKFRPTFDREQGFTEAEDWQRMAARRRGRLPTGAGRRHAASVAIGSRARLQIDWTANCHRAASR